MYIVCFIVGFGVRKIEHVWNDDQLKDSVNPVGGDEEKQST